MVVLVVVIVVVVMVEGQARAVVGQAEETRQAVEQRVSGSKQRPTAQGIVGPSAQMGGLQRMGRTSPFSTKTSGRPGPGPGLWFLVSGPLLHFDNPPPNVRLPRPGPRPLSSPSTQAHRPQRAGQGARKGLLPVRPRPHCLRRACPGLVHVKE